MVKKTHVLSGMPGTYYAALGKAEPDSWEYWAERARELRGRQKKLERLALIKRVVKQLG